MHSKVARSLPTEWRDVGKWPAPPDGLLEGDKLARYRRTKRAIERYVRGGSVAEILKDENLDMDTLYRLYERCIHLSPSGAIYGFNALIPYLRQQTYQRTADANDGLLEVGTGASGLFRRLLSEVPDTIEWIEKAAAKYVDDEWLHRRIPVQYEHKKFLQKLAKCRTLKAYPFNVKSQGAEGFRTALKAAIANQRAETHGDYKPSVARQFMGNPGLAFYRSVQIDAHKLDRLFPVKVYGKGGKFIIKLVRLQWLLAGEANSSAGIGHRLCRGKEPSELDMRYCLYDMMSKWCKRGGPFEYASEESGLPSGLLPSCNGRYPSTISADNALCSHANALRDDIAKCLYATLKLGKAAEPKTRSEIEQKFNNITHKYVQHLPGSIRPDMSKSELKRILKLVERDAMTYDEIESLMDVILSDDNATGSSKHYSKSPLEVLGDEAADALRMLDDSMDASWRSLLTITLTVFVRAADGHTPHINYESVEYSSHLLRSMALVGKEIKIRVNLADLRMCEAFMMSGVSLGHLTAQNGWDEFKHDLAVRKILNQAICSGRFVWLAAEPLEEQLATFLKKRHVLICKEQEEPANSSPPKSRTTAGVAPSTATRRVLADIIQGEEIDIEAILGDRLEG